MKLLNALSISFFNTKSFVKSLFMQLLFFAMALAVGVMLAEPLLDGFSSLASESGFTDFIIGTLVAIDNGTFDSIVFSNGLRNVIDNTLSLIGSIENIWGKVEISYLIFLLTYFVYRVGISFTDVAVCFEIDEFMSSNSSRPFTWYFFKKFKEALWYSVLLFLIVFPLDLVVLFASMGFYLLILVTFREWTIVPAVAIALVLYALRHTLFAFFLPSIAVEKLPVTKALSNGFSKLPKSFWKVFWKYLLLLTVMATASLLIVFSLSDVMVKLVSVVINFVLYYVMKCVAMTEYYSNVGKPYFSKKVLVEGTEGYNRKHKKQANG